MHAHSVVVDPSCLAQLCTAHDLQHSPAPHCPMRLEQVPSHTPILVDMLLDMISDNKLGNKLPHGLHFKDKSGKFSFHANVAPYLEGLTTRVCANVFNPQGGGAGSNNATESQNRMSHTQMPVRKAPVAHVVDLLRHMQTVSAADTTYDDGMRRDIWHHDLMIAVERLSKWQPYPACSTCIINLVDCHFLANVNIETLDPAAMCYGSSPGADRFDRVLDFKNDMRPVKQQCIVMPTYKTMMTVINNYPEVLQANVEMPTSARVQLIKNFLSSPTKKPTEGPSWLASFVNFHNVEGKLSLEDMTLGQWYDVVHSFALMPPLTDKDAVARYLGRLEKGIPIRDKSSTRLGNGCLVHWGQVPDSGVYYCLCPDHLLRGICLHVMLWLVSQGIVSLPPKWSAATIAGPRMKGRDRHYVEGSALVRDPHHQPSRHSLAKIAKSAMNPRSQHDTTQALIACMGTINVENDSVRKYTEDKYTHGPDKYKHRPNKKAKGHGTNLSKKSEHQRRMPSIPETEESLDESLSENGQASTKKKRKKKTSGARRKTAQASSDSDEDSVSSTELFKPRLEVGGQK